MDDRLPIHARALALFIAGYPSDLAQTIARLETREIEMCEILGELEAKDIDERPSSPPGRLCGAERNG